MYEDGRELPELAAADSEYGTLLAALLFIVPRACLLVELEPGAGCIHRALFVRSSSRRLASRPPRRTSPSCLRPRATGDE